MSASAPPALLPPTSTDVAIQHVLTQFQAWDKAMQSADEPLTDFYCRVAIDEDGDHGACVKFICAMARDGFSIHRVDEPNSSSKCTPTTTTLCITFTVAHLAAKKAWDARQDKIRAKAHARTVFVWTSERDAQLVAQRAAGKQFRAIAAELGVSTTRTRDRYARIRSTHMPGAPPPPSCSQQQQ